MNNSAQLAALVNAVDATKKRRPFLVSDALSSVLGWGGGIGGATGGAILGKGVWDRMLKGNNKQKLLTALLYTLAGGAGGATAGSLAGTVVGGPVDAVRHWIYD